MSSSDSDTDLTPNFITEEAKAVVGVPSKSKQRYLKSYDDFMKWRATKKTALVKSSLKAFNLMRLDQGGKGGTIINISSIVALVQGSLLPVYSATKSAVLQFSNGLGSPTHYKRSGVRVITLCFGCTRTALFNEARMGSFDKETEDMLFKSLNILPWQKPESAVIGLMDAYQQGCSGSTWLVTSGKPAKDITANVKKAYEIMSEGVFEPSIDFPE